MSEASFLDRGLTKKDKAYNEGLEAQYVAAYEVLRNAHMSGFITTEQFVILVDRIGAQKGSLRRRAD